MVCDTQRDKELKRVGVSAVQERRNPKKSKTKQKAGEHGDPEAKGFFPSADATVELDPWATNVRVAELKRDNVQTVAESQVKASRAAGACLVGEGGGPEGRGQRAEGRKGRHLGSSESAVSV